MKQNVRTIRFEEDEMCVISCFDTSSRSDVLKILEYIRPFSRDDTDLSILIVQTIEKLKMITDAEFNGMDFEVYRYDDEEDEAQ